MEAHEVFHTKKIKSDYFKAFVIIETTEIAYVTMSKI